MNDSLHPAASNHLPVFITPPGETDVFMVVMVVFLIFIVLAFGIVFFRLHTMPERIAHSRHKLQLEIVAVLGLISLFTHMHIFWIIGLILALIDLPDFSTPLNRIAGSAEKIAGKEPEEGDASPNEVVAGAQIEERAGSTQEAAAAAPTGNAASSREPQGAPTSRKEPLHA